MITRIKWKKHHILGNLELNFTDKTGKVYNTIILAGENGTGKTTILNTIGDFLNIGSIAPFEFIQYKIKEKEFKIFYDDDIKSVELGFHKRTSIQSHTTKKIITSKGQMDEIEQDEDDIRHYGVSYSAARTGFKLDQVSMVTTSQIDNNRYNIEEDNDFTNVKQLLVDLSSQDNADWMKITKSGVEKNFSDFEKDSKLHRFEKAFDNFFDKLKFEGIDEDDANGKIVLFKKNSDIIPVDSLSTGEKQIIFRGSQLLKNINSVKDGIVLIDEPELSMHPKWQEKILKYYRGLFTNKHGQFVQMILATHSQFIVKSAIKNENNVLVIVLKEDNHNIKPVYVTDEEILLPTITSDEINYLAFDVISAEYYMELYNYLQTLTGKDTIKKMDCYISKHPLYERKYQKTSTHLKTTYDTLPTYVRNAISHPENSYSDEELELSVELIREICKTLI